MYTYESYRLYTYICRRNMLYIDDIHLKSFHLNTQYSRQHTKNVAFKSTIK